MNADGTCPTCGRSVEAQQPLSKVAKAPITAKNLNLHQLAAGEGGDAADAKAPWHFKVLMVMLAMYLGWRVVQLFV